MRDFAGKTIWGAFPLIMVLVNLGPLASSLRAAGTFATVAPLSFTKPFGGANPLPQTVLVAAAANTQNFAFTTVASTSSGGSWLSVTGVGCSDGCGMTPQAVTVVVASSVTLALGTYNGQIVFSNGTTSITVAVTLIVAPANGPFLDNVQGALNFFLALNGANPPAQEVQIRNGGSGSLVWTQTHSTADGGNWISASAASGSAGDFLTVGVSVSDIPNAGLLAGTYIGNILIQTSGSSVSIPISVTVGVNVLNQINPLYVAKAFGGADPLPQVLTIGSTATTVGFSTTVYTATGGNWLSVTGVGCSNGCGSTPQVVTAVISPSVMLVAGTYTAEVVIGAGIMSATVGVTLTVSQTASPFFDSVPGAMNFSLATDGGTPPGQTVQIRNAGSGSLPWTLTKTTSDSGAWLKVSVGSGTAPSLVTVSVLPQNLPNGSMVAGTFTGQILFQAAGSAVTIPISVTVGGNVVRQMNPISFSKALGGANPLPQVLLMSQSDNDGIVFSTSVYTASGGSWLTVTGVGCSNGCGTTPQVVTAIVNPSPTLAAGTYTGEIVFITVHQAVTVGVTLTVASAAQTFFDSVQGGMNFTMTQGGLTPNAQNVQLRNAGPGILNWTLTASTADGGAWLNVSATNGTAPSTVTVSVTPGALPGGGSIVGWYTGELVFRTGQDFATIPVTVLVGPTVFVELPPLTFTKQVGGSDPPSQTLNLTTTGTNIGFTTSASAGNGGNWLSVTGVGCSDGCGSAPQAVTAVVNPSATLAAGTYTGQIVFVAAGEAMTVPIYLTVGTVPVAGPFGSFDTPANNSTNLAGGVGFTGWALSYIGVTSLGVYRNPLPGEGSGLVFVGDAEFITGSRPDVATAYPGYPYNTRGWGFQVLTNELPGTNGQAIGNGTYTFHAIAADANGLTADLGSKTITVNNAGSVLPFGAIDTPTQGGIASGSAFVNFGWALTPQPNLIPTNGSTITVFIDNVPKGHPVYNNARSDIQTLFPGYQNTNGAVGYFLIDTTQLTNGLHSIAWSVKDNAGHANGIGSRYFIVQN